jgi:hypothetical protein
VLRDFEKMILNHLSRYPSGLTITDISKGIKASRNTVSKYISILEIKEEVFTRKVGAYTLYYNSERNFLPRENILNFYKVLISCLKTKYPYNEAFFKEIGKKIGNSYTMPIGSSLIKEFDSKKNASIKDFLTMFGDFYSYLDFLQGSINISQIKFNEQGNKAIYRFKDSILLEDTDDFIYHFYTVCGLIELTLTRELKKTVNCNVEKINISTQKDESFIEISLEII